MLGANLLLWAHLCAMAAYFGAQFAVIYMLLPAAERAGDESARRAALITGFRFYNPFVLAALGLVLMTGAMMITDLKAGMQSDYFARIGRPLALKLLLAFLVIFLQTYITFGLAFRIGRQEEVAAHGDGEPFTNAQIDSMLRRIRYVTWFTIVLTAAIILVSLRISERASGFANAFSRFDSPAHAGVSSLFRRARGAPAAAVATLMRLDQRYERADGVEQRDNREHRTRHLAQHHALRDPVTLGRGPGIGVRCYRHDPRLVSRRVHCHLLRLVAFWSDAPQSARALGQRQERGHDVEERHEPEHYARQFAEQAVLRVARTFADLALATDPPNPCQPCLIHRCVHLSFLRSV
ncbi:MAG: hypothetical protein ACREQF_12295 [Candidatus Binataceae bacterium]